jgi:ABC-2 type transport system permease protein
MKQFVVIFLFELKNYFKNKTFIGVTVALMLLIAGVMFFPRITENFNTQDKNDTKPVMAVAVENSDLTAVADALASGFFDCETVYFEKVTADEIRLKVENEEVDCAFYLTSPTSYTYFVKNMSLYDQNTAIADSVLNEYHRRSSLLDLGLTNEQVGSILNAPISGTTENLGKDQMSSFFYTYIMIFALYMVILLYGQMVASGVATEKSSRAMEVLITSAKPVSMMFGKVISACLAGLTQLLTVFGSAFVFYGFNKKYWSDNAIICSIFDIPLDLLIFMTIFFVLGFLIYAFLYGAIGSTVSKLEDLNTAVMPVTMLFIVAFMVVMFSMTGGNIDNTLMKVCSFIPFTSPMAMFTRIAMSTVPAWEIAVSLLILVLSVFGIGYIAAKIYRIGVLLYGTKLTPKDIIKSIKNS